MRASALPRLTGFYVAMLAIALAAMAARGHLDVFLPSGGLRGWALSLGLGAGVGFGAIGLTRWTAQRFVWARLLEDEFRAVLGDLRPSQAFVAACASAVAEETLFRGLLQPLLGLWIAAAIFGVLHVGPNVRFAPWTVMAFVAGVTLGWMFQWTGALLAPMLAHFLINYVNLRHLTGRPVAAEVRLGEGGTEHLARR